jgi:tRNA A-37 threonylcarbamoyl transferase component Bud32
MSWEPKEPTSFSVVKIGNTTFLVKEGYKETILSIVFDKNFSQIGKKDDTNRKFGRGIYLSVPAIKNSTERFVIRNYRHGGLLGKLFGGVFYDGNRPLNEVHLNEIAARKGVPSAEVIAVAKRKLWGVFYKADFISKEIAGAVDLVQFLKESSPAFIQKSKKSVIYAVVKLIRSMHDAGIYHADLHLKNILLKSNTNGEFHAYIIDLDKSAALQELNIRQRIKNLLRLDRSLEKLCWSSGETEISLNDVKVGETYQGKTLVSQSDGSGERVTPLSLKQKTGLISRADRIRFLKSYMLHGNALDTDWKKYVRQYQSRHAMHKLWWRVFGLT